MVIRGYEMDEVLKLFKAGRSKAEIGRAMGKDKKWVEKVLPRAMKENANAAAGKRPAFE